SAANLCSRSPSGDLRSTGHPSSRSLRGAQRMTPLARPVLTVALASLACACASTAARQTPASRGEPPAQEAPTAAQQAPTAAPFQVPVDYYKLDNGLKVVLSRDTT